MSVTSTLFLLIVVVLFIDLRCDCRKIAYVTTLVSDDYLLTVRVLGWFRYSLVYKLFLGYSLRQLSPNVSYLIVYTNQISQLSIDTLIGDRFETRQVDPIASPYATASPHHLMTKYQYTKVRLWSLIDYDTLVHLDADTLPLTNVDALFNCGTFCAVFRHSDMFNSGVFTLKPNTTIYNDMISRIDNHLASYDGGDQGLLNSYFDRLKYAPMFDPSSSSSINNNNDQRLSSAYNYDIGMYYLNARSLIDPVIIHYTFGPIKPWIWYTYPLFDLNWYWLAIRNQFHLTDNTHSSAIIAEVILLIGLVFINRLSSSMDKYLSLSSSTDHHHRRICSSIMVSIMISALLVPTQMLPTCAWIMFGVNQLLIMFVFNAFLCRSKFKLIYSFILISTTLFIGALLWFLIYSITHFHYRLVFVFICIIIYIRLLYFISKKQLL